MRRPTTGERGGIVAVLGLAVVLVMAGGAAFWWFFVRSDAAPPPRIEETNLAAGGSLDGTWTVRPGGESYVQYRVKEQLVGAVLQTDATGRSSSVDATMTIRGSTISGVSATADLVTLTSDKDRRDRYIRDNGLQSHRFPTATFVATQPITLAEAPQKGEKVTTRARGMLTLHGITHAVTWPLVGRWDGTTVQVVGTLPIRFVDYGITPPNIGGFVAVGGTGRIELALFFAKG
jgi:polyisoprenoid-binding protein YceI